MSNCELLGNKVYLSTEVQLDLFNSVKIKLDPILKGEQAKLTPKSTNQKDYKPQLYSLEN